MINSYTIGYITKDTIDISIGWNVSKNVYSTSCGSPYMCISCSIVLFDNLQTKKCKATIHYIVMFMFTGLFMP